MKLKLLFITVLMCLMTACNYEIKQDAAAIKADSLRVADSIARVNEKQRIIDSVNKVSKDQQIIADSIQRILSN